MLQEKYVKPEKLDLSFKPASSLNYEITKAYIKSSRWLKLSLANRPKTNIETAKKRCLFSILRR